MRHEPSALAESAPGRPDAPHILFVDHAAVLGGAELSLLDLARHHRARSRVVLFGEGPFREALTREGVPVSVLPMPAALAAVGRTGILRPALAVPGLVSMIGALARMARGAEVVHCNSQKAFVVGALAGRWARRPVVWHLRDMLTSDHFGPAHRRVAATLANHLAAKVIANSQATAEAFVAAGGDRRQVVVVYNGIDPAAFLPMDPAEARMRAGLELPDRAFLVGAFSRIAPWKGQHILLRAMSAVPEAHAILVGDALFGEQAYLAQLRNDCDRMNIRDRVHFLGFRRDIPTLMAACDVVVHTSVSPEPFGRMIVEAQLVARPVVATRAGGARELIDDGKTGWLVPPGDVAALAGRLRGITADPVVGTAVAQRGRTSALERFAVGRMLREFDREIAATLRREGAGHVAPP